MEELIDLVMTKLYPSLEYKVSRGVGEDLTYVYTIYIENIVIMYDIMSFNFLYKEIRSGRLIDFSPEQLERDLHSLAGLNAIVSINY